ncbi:MAG: recombination mediator RecR [Candidatus Omnitrophica bacterium]|nr:recombination mediator RecR [Candidatus Omnitrophota bacterium]MCM8788179.1 recombination mediator RecR [Candidatus Omnitrophota bacterium]
MEIYPKIITSIIEQLKKLPGIGTKSAERIVECFLKMESAEVACFAENLKKLKESVKLCKICFSISEDDVCQICRDSTREKKIAVVEEYKDLIALEKAGFRGMYHVLGGRINPLEKIGPENLSIDKLIERLEKENFSEIIIATNPTPEGESTAIYLAGILKKRNYSVSRLATGIPVGSEIEYIDPETLRKSIEHRFKT